MPSVPNINDSIGKKTKHVCNVCAPGSDTKLVVKQVIDSTTVLVCPKCDSIEYKRSSAVSVG